MQPKGVVLVSEPEAAKRKAQISTTLEAENIGENQGEKLEKEEIKDLVCEKEPQTQAAKKPQAHDSVDIAIDDAWIWKGLQSHLQVLALEVNKCTPGRYPYSQIHVLMVTWKDGELTHEPETKNLERVLRDAYRCTTIDRYFIPNEEAQLSLKNRLTMWIGKYSDPKNLLILHYKGHGGLTSRNHLRWSGRRGGPKVDWYMLQNYLEKAASDVLLLIDACHSGASINVLRPSYDEKKGTTELIAASGFAEVSFSGSMSFSVMLAHVLTFMSTLTLPFSVMDLHRQLYNHMLLRRKESYRSLASPVYLRLTGDFTEPSIMLQPLKHKEESEVTGQTVKVEGKVDMLVESLDKAVVLKAQRHAQVLGLGFKISLVVERSTSAPERHLSLL